jgi:hypothetical protein
MFVGADAKNLYLGMWKEALCERFVRRWALFETSNREMISSMGKRAVFVSASGIATEIEDEAVGRSRHVARPAFAGAAARAG